MDVILLSSWVQGVGATEADAESSNLVRALIFGSPYYRRTLRELPTCCALNIVGFVEAEKREVFVIPTAPLIFVENESALATMTNLVLRRVSTVQPPRIGHETLGEWPSS